MKLMRNNNNMIQIEKGNKNNWKGKSQKYVDELDRFLQIIKKVEDENLKREILMSMLRVDNELTIFAERLFDECYNAGYEDGQKL